MLMPQISRDFLHRPYHCGVKIAVRMSEKDFDEKTTPRSEKLEVNVHERDPSDSMESTLQGSNTPAPGKLHHVSASNDGRRVIWKRGNSFQPIVHSDRFARLVEEDLERGLDVVSFWHSCSE